jgi:hypothetical protein
MEKEKHHPLIRTIYLYLFALAGLIIVIQAGIRALNMALEVFVFKDIAKQERLNYMKPISPSYIAGIEKIQDDESLTEDERASIRNWIENYEEWKEETEEIDQVSIRRQEEGASILAQIVVGVPLYMYHWSVIQKETKNKDE